MKRAGPAYGPRAREPVSPPLLFPLAHHDYFQSLSEQYLKLFSVFYLVYCALFYREGLTQSMKSYDIIINYTMCFSFYVIATKFLAPELMN